MQRRLLGFFFLFFLVPASSYAQDCTNPNGAMGGIVYNSNYDVFQGCTHDGWKSFHPVGCPDGDSCSGAEPPPSCAPDDLVWATHSIPNDSYGIIAYGNGRFVATGKYMSTNRVIVSTDGISWTAHPVPTTGPIAYGNNRFVMVRDTTVLVSEDGEDWTIHNNAIPNGNWDSVVYGSDGFVAVSGSNAPSLVAHSEDGLTWTGINVDAVAPGGRWLRVAYGGGRYVASCGFCYDGNGTSIMSSTDGQNWTANASGYGSWATAYGNGRYVSGSTFAHSTNGTSWTIGGWSGVEPNIQNVVFIQGFGFIALDESGRIYESVDGLEWTSSARPAGIPWVPYPNALAYGGGAFVALSDNLVMRGACPAPPPPDPPGPPAPTGCNAIGDFCDDGSRYVGSSPDGDVPMYMTALVHETYVMYSVADPTGVLPHCPDGGPDTPECRTGESNTALLAAKAEEQTAARYCNDLVAHGHDDWYLPSRDEFVVMANLHGTLGSDLRGNHYPTSSTTAPGHFWAVNAAGHEFASGWRGNSFDVRCVRK